MRTVFNQNLMIVDAEDIYTKIVVSKNKKIIEADKIETPEGTVKNNSIQDSSAVAEKINEFKAKNNIQVSNVVFVIKGQDVVVRHLEVPIMKAQEIEKSVKWEISQSLPEQGDDYYIDFEIVDKIENEEKKVYKLLVAAVQKEKIHKYVEISKKLNMKLIAVDLEANCISRVFSKRYDKNKNEESIGIVEIGEKESSIIILDKGKLFIERELFFGINNIINQLTMKSSMTEEEAKGYLIEKIDLVNINEADENEVRIKRLFDNVFTSFEKVIQFFYSGRAKRSLDKVYLIGEGTQVKNIENYVKNFLNTDTEVVDNSFATYINIGENCDIKEYLSLFGVLFRNNKYTELNILPYETKNKSYAIQRNKLLFSSIAAAVFVFLIVAVSFNFYKNKLKSDNDKIEQQIRIDSKAITENTKLINEKQQYLKQINLVDTLEKNKLYYSEWLKEMVAQLPPNVTVESIGKDSNSSTLNIQGTAKDVDSISKYSANLQNSGKFTNIKISSISQDTNNTCKFSLSVKEVVKK